MPDLHVNFYENHKEAVIRLRNTVVLYDGQPYHVMAITDHKGDGVFRIYLRDMSGPMIHGQYPSVIDEYPTDHPSVGGMIDTWMAANPAVVEKIGLIRKSMDSKHFNKFRPFPLGMCNFEFKNSRNVVTTGCYYLERQPMRPKTEQGLTAQMIVETRITMAPKPPERAYGGGGLRDIALYSPGVRDCILGKHPSAKECLDNLLDPEVSNDAVAFHRNFALVRGPIGMLFLAYKEDIVGILPNNNFTLLQLGRDYGHTKEVIGELGVFGNISIK